MQAGQDQQNIEPITFSIDRGIYTESFPLALTPNVNCLIIRYTIDGSVPDAQSDIYPHDGKALAISNTTTLRAGAFVEGVLLSSIYTHSYLFIDDVLTQPTSPSGWPATWGNHRIDIGPYQAGEPVVADYEMAPY